jgi:hypothetical protein
MRFARLRAQYAKPEATTSEICVQTDAEAAPGHRREVLEG